MQLRNNLALPQGFKIVPKQGGLSIVAPTKTAAQDYADQELCRLRRLILSLDSPVEISWGGKGSLRFTPEMVRRSVEATPGPEQPRKSSRKKPPEQKIRGIIRSATDLDWNAIINGENPVYISQMEDQHNLFINTAAVSAQSGKPPKEFLAATAHALNSEEELQNRCKFLLRDGSMTEYDYRALRWYRDPESGIWVRKHMDFISNFWKIDYLGQPCWMVEVLEAAPRDKHLDS